MYCPRLQENIPFFDRERQYAFVFYLRKSTSSLASNDAHEKEKSGVERALGCCQYPFSWGLGAETYGLEPGNERAASKAEKQTERTHPSRNNNWLWHLLFVAASFLPALIECSTISQSFIAHNKHCPLNEYILVP